ncbi:uncharacterized protein LOC117807118 [Notolabrus celidotus]|uniref:uncharacterized protein LOC117807118 n=1 Tax=Notolabrus celidotus TaxID=1203425 RepID=UPI00149040C3|nr:uncharacterized protein LOC117807118 [Notolabrus celidotus]
MLKLYLFFFLLRRADGVLLYADPRQNVSLPCFLPHEASHLCWYKQVAGEQPKIISSFYKALSKGDLHNQFKEDKRFSVHAGEGFYNLNISHVQDSDSAMYYCGHTSITTTEFNEGVYLVLRESSRRSYILQPASDLVTPGGSTTLSCAVHIGTCDGEHRVYWFKKESGNSHVGIMYIHTKSRRQCGLSPGSEPPERRCVYSLSKRNVSESDAGTYYCAVAHCGEILLGNGTKLNVGSTHVDMHAVLMYCVVAALLFSVILNTILICILCKKRLHSGGLQPQSSVQEQTPDSQNTDLDSLQYVALEFKKGKNKRRQRGTTEEKAIYSVVRRT